MYENVPGRKRAEADPAGYDYFDERAAGAGVADPNAGMGIAAADYDGDELLTCSSRTRADSCTPPSSQPAARGGAPGHYAQVMEGIDESRHGLGCVVGGSISTRTSTSCSREWGRPMRA